MVSVTIRDDTDVYVYVYIKRDVEKKPETIVQGRANRSLYLGFGVERQSNHLAADSLRSVPQESWS